MLDRAVGDRSRAVSRPALLSDSERMVLLDGKERAPASALCRCFEPAGGEAVCSEAALRRRDPDLLELLKEGEDLGVVLVLRELELGLGVDVRLRLLGLVANAQRDF